MTTGHIETEPMDAVALNGSSEKPEDIHLTGVPEARQSQRATRAEALNDKPMSKKPMLLLGGSLIGAVSLFTLTTLVGNPFGAGIVKNASTKIIGKQPGDMTTHRECMNLNETAINQIKAFAQPKKGHSAEFLIAIGEKAESTHVIRIAPTPVDYWITTTYPRERVYRRWWLNQHANVSRLDAYEALAERFPRGLAELAQLPEEVSGEVREVKSL